MKVLHETYVHLHKYKEGKYVVFDLTQVIADTCW